MATLLRALALIRRIYALGSFLRCSFKCLLFILCRKLTSWLAGVPASLAMTRRRLWYYKDVVVSRKPRSYQPSWTLDYAPLVGFPDSKGPTTAASTLPVSSSSQLLQASVSRASIRVLSPDVGRCTSVVAISSHQDYSMPESTSQNSGAMTPESTGDLQIDVIPLMPGESGKKTDLEFR